MRTPVSACITIPAAGGNNGGLLSSLVDISSDDSIKASGQLRMFLT